MHSEIKYGKIGRARVNMKDEKYTQNCNRETGRKETISDNVRKHLFGLAQENAKK
jgi:hypothetical protein